MKHFPAMPVDLIALLEHVGELQRWVHARRGIESCKMSFLHRTPQQHRPLLLRRRNTHFVPIFTSDKIAFVQHHIQYEQVAAISSSSTQVAIQCKEQTAPQYRQTITCNMWWNCSDEKKFSFPPWCKEELLVYNLARNTAFGRQTWRQRQDNEKLSMRPLPAWIPT